MKWEDIIKGKVTAYKLNLNVLLIEYLKENLDTLPRTFDAGYFVNEPFLSEFKENVKDYALENNIATQSLVTRFFKKNAYRTWAMKSWAIIKEAYKEGELPILVRMGNNTSNYTFEVLRE